MFDLISPHMYLCGYGIGRPRISFLCESLCNAAVSVSAVLQWGLLQQSEEQSAAVCLTNNGLAIMVTVTVYTQRSSVTNNLLATEP